MTEQDKVVVLEDNHRLRTENDTLRKERDEARRAVCCSALPSDYTEWKPTVVAAAVRLIAAQQGWDCYRGEERDE